MKTLFLTALEISLSTSFVVLFLLLTSRILSRRYAAKWKYAIWVGLGLRLVLPFKMSLPQKQVLLDVPARLAAPMVSSEAVMAVAPDVAQTVAAQSLSLLDVLAVVWLVGAVLFLLTHLLSYVHYRRTVLKHGQRVTDVSVLQQIRSISQELSIRRRMPVIQDITASTPMVIGFFRPILVMPDMEYQPMELYFVLKHELIHLKRGDMFAKLLFVAANALHWFNPLMYLMQKEAVVDMELSCDERVVKGTVFETRKAYTETLLSTLCRSYKRSTALSTQFFGDKAVMKKRFQNIMTRARKKSGLTVLVVVLAAALILGAVFGLSAGEPEMEEAQRMLAVANDFKDAYVAGDREAMKQYLADTYEGELDIQPVTDLGEGRGVNLYGDPQPGDLSINVEDSLNVTSTNAPIGSTFTALARTNSKVDHVDAMRFSFIKQEDGWKIRAYELVKNETVGEATAATEVQETVVTGDDSSNEAYSELKELSMNAVRFAMAYFEGDSEKLDTLTAENFVGDTTPYYGPTLIFGEAFSGEVKYAPQMGDLSVSRNDELSVFSSSIPERSTMTVLLELKDPGNAEKMNRFYVSMTREAAGWRAFNFRYDMGDDLSGDAREIVQLANDFTYAYFASDPELVASYMTTPHSKYSDPTVDPDAGFLGIHAVKGVPEYTEPAKVGARAAISVEFRAMEYGEDSYTYLSMELAKKEDGWKVYSYGVEK